MLSFAAKTCYNRFCFRRKRFFGHFSGWKGSRVVYAGLLIVTVFFILLLLRARALITPPARSITSRPCAVIGSTSITPVPRATATSICSVNSRFPLDFERKISYTKSVYFPPVWWNWRLRPGFKIPCSQERAGSTPATGTTLEKNRTCFFAGSVFILQRRFFLHFIGCDRQKLLHRRPVERIHRLFFRLAPLQRLANRMSPCPAPCFPARRPARGKPSYSPVPETDRSHAR